MYGLKRGILVKEINIVITEHAYNRAKERLKWKKATLDRMAYKAYKEGLSHKEVNGRIKNYLEDIYRADTKLNNMRVYGENIFIFTGSRLITIYRLPNDLSLSAQKCKK
jgi:hypothetical protein